MFEPKKTEGRPDLYEKIYKDAVEAGLKAHTECKPTPVSWVSVDLDDNPIEKPSDIDEDGEAGGAYICIVAKPNSENFFFMEWCLKKIPEKVSRTHTRYYYNISVDKGNYKGQSAEKAEAAAKAFAETLNKYGIRCSVGTYLS
jgi:hypothetical protein